MGRIVLVLVSFLFFQIFITVHAQLKPTYENLNCEAKNLNYTVGSVYEKILKTVLNNLASKAGSQRFYSSTVGEDSIQVYGLFQCRFDVSSEFCSLCVKQATSEIKGECPSEEGEAILWYVECMVRFSNRNIFSRYEASPMFSRKDGKKANNQNEFGPRLKSTLKELIENTSSTTIPFASGETKWASSGPLYSYAQCTPDINSTECSTCLKVAASEIIDCCSDNEGAMVFLPSCQLRYDMAGPFLGDLPSSSGPPPVKQVSEPSKKVSSMNNPIIIGGIVAGAGALVGLFILGFVLWCFTRRRKLKEARMGARQASARIGARQASARMGARQASASARREDYVKSNVHNLGDTEFLQYDFATLKTATKNFSSENKLGQGGFGTVYKGTFENGDHQLAIKRLSGTSGQGTKEFMTEARLLAKLQHKNLVKLVGFCSEGDEKLLVYEFMSNASLDRFLFDQIKRPLFNWATRSNIIMGIARGLQYLHEDSRLTIIHRDLKPGNILLDNEMNPKIADFGLAKLFEGEQKFGNTSRIVGTIGYMAPEYMTTGEYSEKSDVYSFGIMLLEIVSGQNNIKFYQARQSKEDLPVHAWKLWNEERSFDLTDPILLTDCSRNDVMRCIQIGLLCLQANAVQRPTMASTVFMLNGSVDLPLPSAPAMSFPQFNMPISYVSGGQQSDVDQYSTMSDTQDLHPKPR